MTGGLRPYPDYRDSGLPWLGPVPAHWEGAKLKRVVRIQAGVTLGKRYDGVPLVECPYLRVANVQNGYLNLKHVKRIAVPPVEAKACALRPGDVVVTEGGDIDKLGRGAIWRGEIEGCIHQNHIFAIRAAPDRLLSRFLSLLLESHHGRTYFYRTAKKTTNLASTNRTTLGEFPVFLPPADEQHRIADFLDAHGRLVQRFIRNKRRMIEVLNEQKQAIINRAVTRGLDSAVRLKPSGIGWLGDVPEHWVVKPLKRWAGINRRVLPETTDPDYEFLYIDIGAVGSGYLAEQPERMRFRNAPSRARRILRRGDTIISTVRTYLKAVYFVADDVEDWVTSTGFAVLMPAMEVAPEFLSFVIQSSPFIERVTANSVGIAYPAIAETRLAAFHLAMPPIAEEQIAIVAHVKDQTRDIDAAIRRIQREIDLTREYRTRLISDVVTGKVDVRQLAPPSEEAAPEELETLGGEGPEDEATGEDASDFVEEVADADG